MQALRLALPGEIPRTGHQYKSTDAIASVLLTHVNKKVYFPETRESRLRREFARSSPGECLAARAALREHAVA